jgi:hypothetical protein
MQWLRGNITDQVFQGGFMGARCLVIPKGYTSRNYPEEPLVDPVERQVLAEALAGYAEHPPTELFYSPEARELYTDWYMNRPKISEDDRIASYFGRKRIHIQKLAMLFALSRAHVPTIEGVDMQSALSLIQWEEPGMVGCFRQVLAPETSSFRDYVMTMIATAGGHIKRSELSTRAGSRMSVYQLDETLSELQTQGLIRTREQRTLRYGKPSGRGALVYYRLDMEDGEGNKIMLVGKPSRGEDE